MRELSTKLLVTLITLYTAFIAFIGTLLPINNPVTVKERVIQVTPTVASVSATIAPITEKVASPSPTKRLYSPAISTVTVQPSK